MNKVVLYTKEFCPFCINAKKFFIDKCVEFEEIDFNLLSDSEMEELDIKTKSWPTVPKIFINGRFIGGYTDLLKVDGEGKLFSREGERLN